MVKTFGGIPTLRAARVPSRRFVAALAVGRGADPEIADFVYELYAATPPGGRGGSARMLVDQLDNRHLRLDGLTVSTLVIGSQRDRLLPIASSRRLANAVPNLIELVELPGGHCAILEQPAEVNRRLRALAESSTTATSLSS